MIKEYAIEPEAINNWTTLKTLLDSFSPYEGRIILEHPNFKTWCQKGFKSFNFEGIKDRKKKLIQECFDYTNQNNNKLRSYFFARENNYLDDWNKSIIKYHEKEPLDGIIARSSQKEIFQKLVDIFIDEETFEEKSINEITQFKKQDTSIDRSCDSFLEHTKKVLRISNEFIFVDPYFENLKQRHLKPLITWMKYISKVKKYAEVHYHTSKSFDYLYFTAEMNKIRSRVPKNIILNVYRWNEDNFKNYFGYDLHNRYILTDKLGLEFNHGLDIDDKNETPGKDFVSIISKDTHINMFQLFTDNSVKSKLDWHSK